VNWTTPADIQAELRRLWGRGLLLASIATGEEMFPRRLSLRGPTSTELADAFPAVRAWIASLVEGEGRHYRVVWRTLRHRIIGENKVPEQIWIDDLESALALIRKRQEAEVFREILAETRSRQSHLVPWLVKRPLKSLELAPDWRRLLDVVDWLQTHPRPGIYLRQIDIPGVDTKFVERHRAVLAQLLDDGLPSDAIDADARGLKSFGRRYGFREEPELVRFRILDGRVRPLAVAGEQDNTLNADAFAALHLPIHRVFITENKTNFLAFPTTPGSIVIFGAGYGFEALHRATWLRACEIHYWGDIDTHGFAILDQLRAYLPHARSFLMDRATLLAHRSYWTVDTTPQLRDLNRLHSVEASLFDELRHDSYGHRVRLEQEIVAFGWLIEAVASVDPSH
jgi:hypothetical protein